MEKSEKIIDDSAIVEQKYESIARLISGVAHDFNNIISIIMGNAQMCLYKLDKKDVNAQSLRDYLNPIMNACERASKIIKQLLVTTKRDEVEFKIVNMNTLLRNLMKLIKELIGENIEIVSQFTDETWYILGNEANLEQVFLNLTINAKDAMPDGGKIFIKTENVEIDEDIAEKIGAIYAPKVEPGKYIKITFKDTGTGIPKDIIDKIFEPYFSTKPKGIGTGLGLAVVQGIVDKHHGYISVESEKGKGTSFYIYFPVITDVREQKLIKDTKDFIEQYQGNGEFILYLEDEDELRNIVSKILSSNGYRVISCKYRKDAEKIVGEHGDKISLFFADIVLIDGSGFDMAEWLRKNYSRIKILLTSGYSEGTINLKKIIARKFKFIPKPYSIIELLKEIKETIEKKD